MAEKLSTRLRRLSAYGARDGRVSSLLKAVDFLDETSRDRTLALVAATYIEDGLRKAIEARFRDDLPTSAMSSLFEGPSGTLLGSFSARIKLADALGWVSSDIADDLNQVRLIRNAFAHTADKISFDTLDIKEAIDTLRILQQPQMHEDFPGLADAPAPMRFGLAVASLVLALREAEIAGMQERLARLNLEVERLRPSKRDE